MTFIQQIIQQQECLARVEEDYVYSEKAELNKDDSEDNKSLEENDSLI